MKMRFKCGDLVRAKRQIRKTERNGEEGPPVPKGAFGTVDELDRARTGRCYWVTFYKPRTVQAWCEDDDLDPGVPEAETLKPAEITRVITVDDQGLVIDTKTAYKAPLPCSAVARDTVDENESLFCWHHDGENRLRRLLLNGIIDCPGEYSLRVPPLDPGDLMRVSLKVPHQPRGRVIALVRLVSPKPFLLSQPLSKRFPYAVRVEVIRRCDLGGDIGTCRMYLSEGTSGSHWVRHGR